MSTEVIATVSAVVGLLTGAAALVGLFFNMVNAAERRSNLRMDRLEAAMKEGFQELVRQIDQVRAEMKEQGDSLRAEIKEQGDSLRAEMKEQIGSLRTDVKEQNDSLRAEMKEQNESLRNDMNRRFDEQDVRIRALEQGQAYMSGQFTELKDYFTHLPPSSTGPVPAD